MSYDQAGNMKNKGGVFHDWMRILGSGVITGAIFATTLFWSTAQEKGKKDTQLETLISRDAAHEEEIRYLQIETEVFKREVASLNVNLKDNTVALENFRIQISQLESQLRTIKPSEYRK